ncbi:MAG TPA: peroxiredoxin [Acidimicrobiales bacterium]|nr:peroxiredoxin [Acidimicrobiales bacterium]
MRRPEVGDPAPGFTLAGTGGKQYSLSDYLGQPVVLAFYPGDNTAVCTTQLRSYSRDWDAFDEVGAVLLGISPQGVASHEDFADRHDLRMPLLADTDKTAGAAYGVIGPMGFYRRSIFVVDAAGVIRYAHRALAGLTFKGAADIAAAVREAEV